MNRFILKILFYYKNINKILFNNKNLTNAKKITRKII